MNPLRSRRRCGVAEGGHESAATCRTNPQPAASGAKQLAAQGQETLGICTGCARAECVTDAQPALHAQIAAARGQPPGRSAAAERVADPAEADAIGPHDQAANRQRAGW